MGASWKPGNREITFCLHTESRQKEKEAGPDYKTKSPAPINILPQARLYLLKVPKPSQSVPPTEDQMLKHVNHLRQFSLKSPEWTLPF